MLGMMEAALNLEEARHGEADEAYRKLLNTYVAFMLAAQGIAKITGEIAIFYAPFTGGGLYTDGKIILDKDGLKKNEKDRPIAVMDTKKAYYRPGRGRIRASYEELRETPLGRKVTDEMVLAKLELVRQYDEKTKIR